MSNFSPSETAEFALILQHLALLDWTHAEGAHQPEGGWGTLSNSEAWKSIEPQVHELLQTVAKTTHRFVQDHLSEPSALSSGLPQLTCNFTFR